MKYLLDVNSLLALAVLNHEFHSRVATWVERLAAKGIPELATWEFTIALDGASTHQLSLHCRGYFRRIGTVQLRAIEIH